MTLALGELMLSEERVQAESRLSTLSRELFMHCAHSHSLALTWHGSTIQMRKDYQKWAKNPVARRAAASRALFRYQKGNHLIVLAIWRRCPKMQVSPTVRADGG